MADHPTGSRFLYVRYEASRRGEGLYSEASYFLDLVERRDIRVPRAVVSEIQQLYAWLHENTPTPPKSAYRDERSRRPITWFKRSAGEHVRRADRLVVLLNRQRVDIRKIERPEIPKVLWEDDVQVVTRRERSPTPAAAAYLEERINRRVRKQRIRRQRAERLKVRNSKSSF